MRSIPTLVDNFVLPTLVYLGLFGIRCILGRMCTGKIHVAHTYMLLRSEMLDCSLILPQTPG